MRFTIGVFPVIILLFTGCSVTQRMEAPETRLELIEMTPLPAIESPALAAGVKMNVLLHVLQDGTVENVKMLGSSGDAAWDVLALESIRHWRYAAPRRDGVPVDAWFRQLVVVQIQEPIVMNIGESLFASQREADSAYVLLEKGMDLDALFKSSVGSVNIMNYPQQVRDQLKRLKEDETTRPLRLGDKYVIYKRFCRSAFKDLRR